ncbi:DEAD/DEAH box helicase [Streptomyces gobiensis]|uniref:DEAD/DEAH box helicase n=1 Tax=Streptomyces gobiensis TaxID=2875706 RepID=UPI001E5A8EFD|nr:AAA domain-containing protein [Streptomyces gobiensis]UGY90782.1 AAA domain-containing protein [Streptomyces gobiensis]
MEPARFPLGRWPEKTEYPLALSQQFAVNRIVGELADEAGLFAVNGPPGTGKTTQLRDLIAAVLVLRAQRLAELARPEDAFAKGKPYRWANGDYQRSLAPLIPELTGHEMLVASANNGAVENVTTEIPARGSIDSAWQEDAEYFPEQGKLILRGEDAWGAVAARLGNRANRRDFRDAYWFGALKQNGAGEKTGKGMRSLLQEKAESRPGPGTWRKAVAGFRAAERAVRTLQTERQRAGEVLRELPSAQRRVEQAQRAAQAARAQHSATGGPLAEARERMRGLERDAARHAERRAQHQRRRPGFLVWVSTFGGAQRDWRREDQELAQSHRDAEAAFDAQTQAVDRYAAEERGARTALVSAEASLRMAEEHQHGLEQAAARDRRRWGAHIPGQERTVEHEGRSGEEIRELSSPWSDKEFTAARTRLFIEAMRLHRAFLEGAADRMRKNLDAAMDVVCGGAPKDLEPEVLRAAWQNLFLAVPVVSTTFASLDRMFAGLPAESLGWLLVDEAGQATAQMPVGALWRSRRAVIVGDPLQLEPIVVLPWTGQQALRRTYGVAQEWAPSWTSAQRVADRLNRYGTELPAQLPDGESRVWVGSPLRVHRRCDNPMFTISNEIAYDGLMVHGTKRADPYDIARRSVWWNVGAAQAQGKWNPQEGVVANTIVHRLVDQGLNPEEDLFIVSPFVDVLTGLKQALCRRIPRKKIGTVHTTQGKEADVVLLVLGAPGDGLSGPRAWAAGTPNLLNVAVSRAKRRLFVVGDHHAWHTLPYFETLAREVPTMTEEECVHLRRLAPDSLSGNCRCGPR